MPATDPQALFNRANQLMAEDRPAEARHIYESLLANRPNHPATIHNIAATYCAQGRSAEAVPYYRRLTELRPAEAIFHWHLALCLLHAGRLGEAWPQYEWRLKIPQLKLGRDFSRPQWRGEAIGGQTILLYTDGGHGDALHFCRYVPMVASLGATLILECHAALVPLLAGLPGLSRIIPRGRPLPPFDCYSPVMSLPGVLGTNRLEQVPNQVPYLHPPPELVEQWRDRLGPRQAYRVGLCWAGSTMPGPTDPRSRSLELFAPLGEVKGVEFHSLQVGPDAHQTAPPGLTLIDHSASLTDFAQTAALVANLDLVITVDTSVPHVAGALGREAWVLLPNRPGCHWMEHRLDSQWYPTLRLYRQAIGTRDWSAIVRQVATDLTERARVATSVS